MPWDEQAQEWLTGALAALRAAGVAGLLERTVAHVWERNVDRFDPRVAGDTATSLGITSSENIRTLLMREDAEVWAERGVRITAPQQALVIGVGALRLLLMKVADRRLERHGPAELHWEATRWDLASDVRHLAALDNAERYEPAPEHQVGQTWWTGLLAGARDDPVRLRHVVLVWAGDPDTATTTGWLGVPYAGPPGSAPWLAIAEVWHHGPDDVPRPAEPVVAVPRARAPSDPPLGSRA